MNERIEINLNKLIRNFLKRYQTFNDFKKFLAMQGFDVTDDDLKKTIDKVVDVKPGC